MYYVWAVGFLAFKDFLCVICGLLVGFSFCVLCVGCWLLNTCLLYYVYYMWTVGFQAFKHFLCVICGLLVSKLLNTFCVLYVGCWFPGF